MVQREPENKYAKLPEPIRPEDMITSLDVQPVQPGQDDYWREVEWLLRTAGVP
jgi:hypothetical protein